MPLEFSIQPGHLRTGQSMNYIYFEEQAGNQTTFYRRWFGLPWQQQQSSKYCSGQYRNTFDKNKNFSPKNLNFISKKHSQFRKKHTFISIWKHSGNFFWNYYKPWNLTLLKNSIEILRESKKLSRRILPNNLTFECEKKENAGSIINRFVKDFW